MYQNDNRTIKRDKDFDEAFDGDLIRVTCSDKSTD